MKRPCGKCVEKPSKSAVGSSLTGGLLVMLLPKCPLCVMAFSSAMTVCGGRSLYLAQNNWLSYLPIVLSGLVAFMIILNWRDARSWYALALAMAGGLFVYFSHQLILPASSYYWGATLLLIAGWLNSNLLSFLSYLGGLLFKSKSHAQG